MEFDIIELTEYELKNFSDEQMKFLRTAQKKKNALSDKLETEKQEYKQKFITNEVFISSLYADTCSKLQADYERAVAVLVEQLEYDLKRNASSGSGVEVGYEVDYSLSYAERYQRVRDYYMSIPDPNERMALYKADEVAKQYLGNYYEALYNALHTYIQP